MLRKIIMIGLVLLNIFGIALAKIDPYIEDQTAEWGDLDAPLPVWSATAAVAHYGRLGEYGDMDAFSFPFSNVVENWPVEIVVPVCGAHFQAVYPSLALVGPGLDIPADDVLPFDLPEGMGAAVFNTIQDGSRLRGDNMVAIDSYQPDSFQINIPAAGIYILVIWEPDGNVGAYALATGANHDQFAPRPESELAAAFRQLETGSWMQQDCNAPIATEACPVTVNEGGTIAEIPKQ